MLTRIKHNIAAFTKLLKLSSGCALVELAHYPLKLVPRTMAVPILSGELRGKRWIVGSAIHQCWLGLYEYEKQQLIARQVRPGTIFYDVGANVGFYSLQASELVGSGRVFAFEPAPRNLSYLEKHLELNHAANVEVLAIAISDQNGTSSFETEESGFMVHLSGEGSIAVPTATLDSLVEEGIVLPPDCVKMDIEGAELLALRGGSRTFQRFRPTILLATHSRKLKEECCQLLESWGYEWRGIQGEYGGELGEFVAEFREQKNIGDGVGGRDANISPS